MFGRVKGDIRKLPPTQNAYKYHMLRALYQIIICKKAHMSTLSLPDATLFGRNIVNGHLASIMMDKLAKPLSAKHLLSV